MFLLYHGSGARDVELIRLMRRKAINYLTLSGAKRSAELLEQRPFELWEGTNGFNDSFDLLLLRLSISRYLELKLDAETETNRRNSRLIADALQEGGNYIRFIAVEMLDDNTEAVSTPVLEITSAVVERALLDFETLTKAKGAVSGIDRVHAALHGYLIAVCRDANITAKESAAENPSLPFQLYRRDALGP